MSDIKKDLWTEDMILALPAGEHDFFDRKSGLLFKDSDFRRDLAKALSAFANSGGGHVLLGVRDDGSVDGVPPFEGRTSTRERIEQIIPHLLSHPLQDFRVHEVIPAAPSAIPPDRVVIVIDVGDSMFAPHQTNDTKDYYFRSGGHSIKAPHVYLEALRSRQRFPSQRVVRAWFDSVVTPLIDLFEAARTSLVDEGLTWRPGDEGVHPLPFVNVEGVRFIHTWIDLHNKEQFFESYPQVAAAVADYDALLRDLGGRYEALHRAVSGSPALLKTYQAVTTSPEFLKVGPSISYSGEAAPKDAESLLRKLFGPRTEPERIASLAEHIVNKIKAFGSAHGLDKFWERFGEQFLAVIDDPSVLPFYQRVLEGQQELLRHVDELIALLKQIRRQLGSRHGVPFTAVRPRRSDW